MLLATIPHRRTTLEAKVAQALDSLGLPYEEQVWRGHFQLDFWLAEHAIAVEACGCEYHGHAFCGHYDPALVARDERRTRILTTQHGVRHVIPIFGCYVRQYGAVEMVRRGLTVAGVLSKEVTNGES